MKLNRLGHSLLLSAQCNANSDLGHTLSFHLIYHNILYFLSSPLILLVCFPSFPLLLTFLLLYPHLHPSSFFSPTSLHAPLLCHTEWKSSWIRRGFLCGSWNILSSSEITASFLPVSSSASHSPSSLLFLFSPLSLLLKDAAEMSPSLVDNQRKHKHCLEV